MVAVGSSAASSCGGSDGRIQAVRMAAPSRELYGLAQGAATYSIDDDDDWADDYCDDDWWYHDVYAEDYYDEDWSGWMEDGMLAAAASC